MEMDQEEILQLVKEQDMRKRMESGQTLIEYLSSIEGEIHWDNIDKIIDSLANLWVASSNFKVALLGLDILSLIVERMQEDFQHHFILVQLALVDRLGDQKDQVRDASITLLTNIMEVSVTPQYVFERLVPNFTHKVWRVRAGLCILLVATINRFGAKSVLLSRLLPHLCKLLADSHAQVRENAVLTLVEIYRHVGERVRQDVMKSNVAQNRLSHVLSKFDAVLRSGDMVSDTASVVSTTSSFDSMETSTPVYSETASTASQKTNVNNNNERSNGPNRVSHKDMSRQSTAIKRPTKSKLTPSSRPSTAAGAMDEDMFKQSMLDNLPKVHFHSSRDMDEQCNAILSVISNEKKDWEERCKALKSLRAIIIQGGTQYDSFYQFLRMAEPALRLNAKDLRSQVVRETCLTIGHLSETIGQKFDHAAEFLLPTLFNLVPNSAKIMATSGIVVIQYILKHTHAPRLIPVIVGNTTSKSTVVRRKSFAFVDLVLQEWSTFTLEKHITTLVNAVKAGISDADAEARVEARKSWWGLHTHFPVESDQMFQQLTPQQQKMIKGQLSASSSTDSLPKSVSSESTNSLAKSRISRPPTAKPKSSISSASSSRFSRSRSDIDPNAAKRSRIKAQSSGYSTVGARRIRASGVVAPTNRGRESDRPSISQPGSRSNSPNSQKGYRRSNMGYNKHSRTTSRTSQSSNRDESPSRVQGYGHSLTTTPYSNGPQRGAPSTSTPPSSPTHTSGRKSKIPISTSRQGSRVGSRVGSRSVTPTGSRGHSRSGSPHRYKGRTSTSSLGRSNRPAPMRVLPRGREGEQAITDALMNAKKSSRGDMHFRYTSDNDDDFSDTSSVCSDRSSSYHRSNGRSKRTTNHHTEDTAEVLTMCQSSHWAERKEGLNSLQLLISRQKSFTPMELKKVLEVFNQMFADPHGKVFSLFLEVLPDFVSTYKTGISTWLFMLLTQLLKKMGADLLGSVQAKVLKALETTRLSFQPDQQFHILTRYIVDQTQTPNLKVKVALLHYLVELTQLMVPSDVSSSSETRLAISRIITWTTEPKSQDVRKAAEAVVHALFDLNAAEFTMMLRVLPKTFQDGAMKVLQNRMKVNGDVSPQPGYVTARVGMSPAGTIVSPRGSNAGYADIVSPRDSDEVDSENLNISEIDEFNQITSSIHKLRLDSSVDDYTITNSNKSTPSERNDRSSLGSGDGVNSTMMPTNVCYPPPFQQIQNSPKVMNSRTPPIKNPFSPVIYKDVMKTAVFDDELDDSTNNSYESNGGGGNGEIFLQFSDALSQLTLRKSTLFELRRALRSGDTQLIVTNQSKSCMDKFSTILREILECLKDTDTETRIMSHGILKEMMLRFPSSFFNDMLDSIVFMLLEAHKDIDPEVVRAADECATTLSITQNTKLCVEILTPSVCHSTYPTVQATIKMMTEVLKRSKLTDLNNKLIAELVPGLIRGYDSSESSVRKAAVFCLVAMHQLIGEQELHKHLQSLSGCKMKLLQLYIKRAQPASTNSM